MVMLITIVMYAPTIGPMIGMKLNRLIITSVIMAFMSHAPKYPAVNAFFVIFETANASPNAFERAYLMIPTGMRYAMRRAYTRIKNAIGPPVASTVTIAMTGFWPPKSTWATLMLIMPIRIIASMMSGMPHMSMIRDTKNPFTQSSQKFFQGGNA